MSSHQGAKRKGTTMIKQLKNDNDTMMLIENGVINPNTFKN